jgi:hypothetical protein
MNKKEAKAEQRVLQRKLFRAWKTRLENGKLSNTEAIRRAKSLSRKRIKLEEVDNAVD